MDESGIFQRLSAVAEIRTRFAAPFRILIDEILSLLSSDGWVLELGAGDGQLTHLIAPRLGPRLLVSEPTETGCQTLERRFPDLTVWRAPAEALPADTGELSVVLGCCMLDVVNDLEASLREIARVLAPGGTLLHLLDLSTDLRALLGALGDDPRAIALPNVFTDPLANSWPEDLFITDRAQVLAVAESLGVRGDPLRRYVNYFAEDASSAVAAFSAIQENATQRREFCRLFEGCEKPTGQPLSSARMFDALLREAAGPAGFIVEEAALRRCTVPAPDERMEECRVGFLQARAAPGRGARSLTAHVFRARLPG